MKCYIVRRNRTFAADVALSGNDLVMSIKSLDENEPRERRINLDSLRSSAYFGDHALFEIYDKATDNSDGVDPILFDTISNVYAATAANKMDTRTYHRVVTQLYPIALVYVPLASAPVSEWSVAINGGADHGSRSINIGAGLDAIEASDTVAVGNMVFPIVQFISSRLDVASDGEVELSFKLVAANGADITDHEAEVYLDCTAGYLAKKRVVTVGGQGSVKFKADGLSHGDFAKIKCGFKYFSGTDDMIVQVQN